MGFVDTLKRWVSSSQPAAAAGPADPTVRAGHLRQAKGDLDHPRTRARDIWTPPDIRHVLHRADSGDMTRLAELCEWVLADDRVTSVYSARAGDILGAPVTFEATGDGRRRNRAVADLEAEEDYYRMFPEPEATDWLMRGWVAGISWAQFVRHDASASRRVVPTLKPWHLRWTRYDTEKRQWYALTGPDGSVEIPMNHGDGTWLAFAPFGMHRPWARGHWRGQAKMVMVKQYGIGDLGLVLEAHGKPAWHAKGAKTVAEREQAAQDLANIGRNPTIATMGEIEVKLIQMDPEGGDLFFSTFEYVNRAIAILGLGGNLATESEKNVATGATSQAKKEARRRASDAETYSTTIREGGLKSWAFWNFGDERLAPWPIHHVEDEEDVNDVATLWKTVSESLSGFETAGYELEDVKDVEDRFGIRLKKKPKKKPPPALTQPPPAPEQDDEEDEESDQVPDPAGDGDGSQEPEGELSG